MVIECCWIEELFVNGELDSTPVEDTDNACYVQTDSNIEVTIDSNL